MTLPLPRLTLALALATAAWAEGPPSARVLPMAFRAPDAAPRGVAESRLLGALPGEERVDATLGLPLRDPEGLAAFRAMLHDPASPLYHQWITPEVFAERFGPTAEDYAKVLDWARNKGLEITHASAGRLVVGVAGPASAMEAAFGVRMARYQHASGRVFRSADRLPSLDLDLDVAVESVDGLNDLLKPVKRMAKAREAPRIGSGPSGALIGADFRKVYAPGVDSTLTGTGQVIGLIEFSTYYTNDPVSYWSQAGMSPVNVVNVPVAGGTTDNSGQDEVSGDIEMAGSMAPAATIRVYEGKSASAILSQIASENLCTSVSVSWGWSSGTMTSQTSIDTTQDSLFQQLDTQGIPVFVASGDTGVWTDAQWAQLVTDTNYNPINPADLPTITSVGGTTLTTGVSAAWAGEKVWNDNQGDASGGGYSRRYALPAYQTSGIAWASVPGASITMRNCPDVAADASSIYVVEGNGSSGFYMGTSLATPIWAGFMALANQSAAAAGQPRLGALNPLLYTVAEGSGYAAAFHDITSGTSGALAAAGFDLATGWGSPTGSGTISALLALDTPVAPAITTQPLSTTVYVGQTASFSVVATGSAPITYQWYRNGAALQGATLDAYTTPAAALSDSGASFTVKLTNSAGSVTSSAAVLTVVPAPVAPSITTQPAATTVMAGSAATFTVTASGTQPFTYQWYRNGTAISGATSASYTTPATALADNGAAFSVAVTNPAGTATSGAATLNVIAKSLDINGDGATDVLDLAALAAAYGTTNTAADLNSDGTVNDLDVALWLAGFGGNP